MESDHWEDIVREFEEEKEILQDSADINCTTNDEWQRHRGDMNRLRVIISLLDTKKMELAFLDGTDDNEVMSDVDYV